MKEKGGGGGSQKYFLSFYKNIKKSESDQNIFLCVLRPPHLKPYWDSGRWEHCYAELTGSILY